VELGGHDRITLQTTRGCPRGCVYCGASRLLGPYRRKPIARVRAELDELVARWPAPFVELADDNTFLDRAWSLQLARLFAQYPLRWFTECDLSVAEDHRLLDALAASGCVQLLVGIESPDARALAGADPAGWRRAQVDRCAAAVARIQAHGIAVIGCFVVGWDADDESVFERTRDHARAMELADVQVTVLTPFPGTELFARLRREGRLLDDRPWDRCTLFDVAYRPNRMSVDALERGLRRLVGEVYAGDEVARRRRRFAACRRTQRERVG
jgi:radical SAM superfamily enzyme YgiQ (UPF0313 family)